MRENTVKSIRDVAGAFGIVCPRIDSRAECEAFVGACGYAPALHGADDVKSANDRITGNNAAGGIY